MYPKNSRAGISVVVNPIGQHFGVQGIPKYLGSFSGAIYKLYSRLMKSMWLHSPPQSQQPV